MYNPYSQYNPYQSHSNNPILPPQQIIQVNGKASVDTIQLAPNSSILLMDTSAPIVWMCVSDGIGKVTATPYDIAVHKEEPPIDVKSMEQRLVIIEAAIAEMEGKLNAEPDVSRIKSKQNSTESIPD